MIIEAKRITLPIFFKYWVHFSHMCCRVALRVGTRYGGNSITNGVSSSLNRNLRNSRAVKTATRIPVRYRSIRIVPELLGKNIPAKRIYTGSLALHEINGFIRIVINLLERLSMVLADIMAGTLHPNPIIKGMNDLP